LSSSNGSAFKITKTSHARCLLAKAGLLPDGKSFKLAMKIMSPGRHIDA